MKFLRPHPVAVLAVMALLGAACSSTNDAATTTTAAAPTDSAEPDDHDDEHDDDHDEHDDHDHGDDHDHDHDHDEGSEGEAVEVAEAAVRLLVADASTGAVAVVDLATGDVIDTLDAGPPAGPGDGDQFVYIGTDGRFAFTGWYYDDAVGVIDGGAWSVDHGDHDHHYAAAPTVMSVMEGPQPAHIVSHDGVTAIFWDGDGEASIIDRSSLEQGEVEVSMTIVTGVPHHGVVVPFEEHFVVSIPSPAEGDLPIGVEVRHDAVTVEATFDDCPELHGEAVGTTVVVFACDDGFLVVSGDHDAWRSAKAAYPGDAGDDRVWTVAGHPGVDWFAGVLGDDAVAVLDPLTATVTSFEVPGEAARLAVADDAHVVVVTTDGLAHLISVDGALEASVPVMEPFEANFGQAQPSVVVIGTRAYVSDPATATITELALNDGLRSARTFDAGVTPWWMAAVGAADR